jgi:hypothetical protein
MKTTTKIGLAAFAFALMFGLNASDTFAFRGAQESHPGEHQKRGLYHKEISEEAEAFRAEQRAEFEDFIGLDEGELKELRDDGEKMSDILDDQNIDQDDMEEFLGEHMQEVVDFITDERDLDDEQVDKLEERVFRKIEHKLDRWYN